MKISKRLETVASFVPKGSNVADIGTDHGYVPIYLVKQGIADRGIAMDVRPGPLARAREHIAEYGVEDRIETRLSDGLVNLKAGEADCVVIAGMGGELMIHILEEGRGLWDSISWLVLSPHSELDKVRKFLEKESFFIARETMVEEEDKFYTIMGVARRTGIRDCVSREIYYRYGRQLIQDRSPVLLSYLKREEAQLSEVAKQMEHTASPSAAERKETLAKELLWNKEAQDEIR